MSVTRQIRLRWVVVAVLLGVLGIIAFWPVETRSGVNYQWSSRRIHLYEKAVDFVSRDLQTRRLVKDILNGITGEHAQVVAIFEWVTRNVRATPEGFPVVDDHVLHIIIRGYGAPDQRTEAFALLASYAGMPAMSTILKSGTASGGVVVALVRIGDRLHMFDVVHQLVFFDHDGRLADVDRLVADPSLIRAAARGLRVNGIPYEQFSLAELRPNFARMEMQKPWYRFKGEASKLFGGAAVW